MLWGRGDHPRVGFWPLANRGENCNARLQLKEIKSLKERKGHDTELGVRGHSGKRDLFPYENRSRAGKPIVGKREVMKVLGVSVYKRWTPREGSWQRESGGKRRKGREKVGRVGGPKGKSGGLFPVEKVKKY